jgi:hypothetical protein
MEELVFSAGLENGAFSVYHRQIADGNYDFVMNGNSVIEGEDAVEEEEHFFETALDLESLLIKISHKPGWLPLPFFNPIEVNKKYAEQLWQLFAELYSDAWEKRQNRWIQR